MPYQAANYRTIREMATAYGITIAEVRRLLVAFRLLGGDRPTREAEADRWCVDLGRARGPVFDRYAWDLSLVEADIRARPEHAGLLLENRCEVWCEDSARRRLEEAGTLLARALAPGAADSDPALRRAVEDLTERAGLAVEELDREDGPAALAAWLSARAEAVMARRELCSADPAAFRLALGKLGDVRMWLAGLADPQGA